MTIESLTRAIHDGDLDQVQKILSQDQDQNQILINQVCVEATGATPLHLACSESSPNIGIIGVLLEGGASCTVVTTSSKQTPFHVFLDSPDPDIDTIRLFLGKGAQWDVQDRDGDTPLHLWLKVRMLVANEASGSAKVEILEQLINDNLIRASDFFAKNNDHKTPLDLVSFGVQLSLFKCFALKYINDLFKGTASDSSNEVESDSHTSSVSGDFSENKASATCGGTILGCALGGGLTLAGLGWLSYDLATDPHSLDNNGDAIISLIFFGLLVLAVTWSLNQAPFSPSSNIRVNAFG